MIRPGLIIALGTTFHHCKAQSAPPALVPQNNTFNSNYILTAEERSLANLSVSEVQNVQVALNFERSNWATGSVFKDPFYSDLPSNSTTAKPGSLIKVEVTTNTTLYTLAPATALSRIIFMSETVNGTAVPASAYVLWPYLPRSFDNKTIPVIGWAHGNSGVYAECAPSHIRNLWYQFSAPYTMALAGYAVVGIDFAGLGVHTSASGENITFQAGVNAAGANDLFYAVKAAQMAFSQLSRSFVVVGHSLGGGAAWGAAERQAVRPVKGYLGAVAGSPITNATALALATQAVMYEGFLFAESVRSVFPSFDVSVMATAAGKGYVQLTKKLQACNSVILELLNAAVASGSALSPANWPSDPTVQAWTRIASSGGKNIAGPLLVLQGLADTTVPEIVTTAAVEATRTVYPNASIEYLRFDGVDHVPAMYASQRIWLDWVADRFLGKASRSGYTNATYGSANTAMPLGAYQGNLNYFLEYVTAPYEVA
jgi:pimeloyl-ACP methyl ester carboxylesterase